jgi:predicted enzyme related to lactoylglutathione lyase
MATTFAPGTPNWVDLGTSDISAAESFYGSLFGWTVRDTGPAGGGYGMLLEDGQEVGGIGPATDPSRGSSWNVYFSTSDADATTDRVRSHGGTVVSGPTDVMDAGRMAIYQDPSGAYFNVWQPGKMLGAELVDAHGALSWVELMTDDIDEAKNFYGDVLGVSTRDVDMAPGHPYTLLQAGGKDVAGAMPLGLTPGQSPHWSAYFAVDDCDEIADRAIALGGDEILRDTSPAGRLAFLADPQGAQFCVITPDPSFMA